MSAVQRLGRGLRRLAERAACRDTNECLFCPARLELTGTPVFYTESGASRRICADCLNTLMSFAGDLRRELSARARKGDPEISREEMAVALAMAALYHGGDAAMVVLAANYIEHRSRVIRPRPARRPRRRAPTGEEMPQCR